MRQGHHLVFRVELRPTRSQYRQLQGHFGALRFAYNCLLSWTIEEYAKHQNDPSYPKPSLTHQSLQKTWTRELRDKYAVDSEGNAWWQENSPHVYRSSATALSTAYTNFFRAGKAGYPKFKSRRSRQSYTTPRAALNKEGTAIYLPRLGEVRLRERVKGAVWLQKMGSTLQEATVAQDATGRVYVSIRYRVEDAVALAFFRGKFSRKTCGFVGVDLGFSSYATVSDGTVVNNPRYYRKLEAKLARAQRAVEVKKIAARRAMRQPKGDNSNRGEKSRNHKRAQLKVSNIHRRIRNQRREFLNHTVRKLVTENTTIVIEDLAVQEMATARIQGSGVKVSHGKSISDASPAEFRRILIYMSERYGTQVIVADRYFPSSKTCSGCGTVKAKLSLSERQYDCAVCGLSLDRDFNAALNLEKWGRDYLTQQAATRYAEALNGRGPEDLIASDQSRRKTAGQTPSKTVKASHEDLGLQEQPSKQHA